LVSPRDSGSRHNPPWLFGLLSIPYGFSNAIIVILAPYLLRSHGVPVDRIANIVAVATLPTVWFFLYSPAVDLGLPRRVWVFLAAGLAAVFSGAGIAVSTISLTAVTVFFFAASAVAGLLSAANGALMTGLDPHVRGRASGWYQGGNLGAGTVGGGVSIWLADRLNVPLLAILTGVLIFLPALAAARIQEVPLPHKRLWPTLADVGRDLRRLVRSRRSWFGLMFVLSPVGSAAVANLISGLGPDYKAPAAEVLWISGIGGGLLTVLGSFIGGVIADRMDRMLAYVLGGGLCAAFALLLGFASPAPWTYGLGYAGYAIAAGLAYAVFTALVLEILGPELQAAGTAYSLFVAAGNVPIVYMTALDGAGYKRWHIHGLMGVDALANGLGALALLFVAMYARRFWPKEPLAESKAP
jgi:PAT family beta-lactamase induction signal transducer AmpG